MLRLSVAVLDLRWGIGWLGHAATGPPCSGEAHPRTLSAGHGRLRDGDPAIVGSVSTPCHTTLNPSLYSFVDRVSRRCKQTGDDVSTCVYDLSIDTTRALTA